MEEHDALGAGNNDNVPPLQVDDVAHGAAAVIHDLAAADDTPPAATADPPAASAGNTPAASDPASVSPRPRIRAPRDSDEDAESGQGQDEREARARHERAIAAAQASREAKRAQALREAQATEATLALLAAQDKEREKTAARLAELQNVQQERLDALLAGQLELEQREREKEAAGRTGMAISGVQTERSQKTNAKPVREQRIPRVHPFQGQEFFGISPRTGRAAFTVDPSEGNDPNRNTEPNLQANQPESVHDPLNPDLNLDHPSVADLFRDFTINRRPMPKDMSRVREEAQEKERINAPRQKLEKSEKLQNPRDFLLVIQYFNLIDGLITRKYWSGSVEQWCLEQILPGSPAASKINEALRGVLRKPDLNYFSCMDEYQKFILAVFFVGSDPFQVVEDHMSLITLHPNEAPSASNTCTTLGFTNRIQDLAAFVPDGQKYPEGILIARIRTRLPLYVRSKLIEIETHTKIFLTTFDQLKPVLERIDAQFQAAIEKQKRKGKVAWDKLNQTMTPGHPKRKAADAALTALYTSNKKGAGGRHNPSRKLDKRPPCAHCKKPGHNESTCWIKFPDKKPDFKSRNKRAETPTAAALQALTAQVAALSAAANN